MKKCRVYLIAGPVLTALGLLVFWLASFSSPASASAPSISIPSRTEKITADRWRILADMQFGLGDPGVVAFQNKIHVISGHYEPGIDNSTTQVIYDPSTNTWEYLWEIFPSPRSNMVVASVGQNIYAIGGWNADTQSVYSYTHKYDPISSEWLTMTSMITPVSGAGGVVIGNSIYVIGGFDGTSGTRDVQIYNTATDSWSAGTPLPEPRSELETVYLGGLIYAIGGNRSGGDPNPSTNLVEIYDPVLDTWTAGAPLPAIRASMAAVVRQGKIYVIGGTDNWASSNVTNTTFVFNPATGLWAAGDAMPTPRRATGAAVLNDIIYVIGGAGTADAGIANEAYGDFEISPSFTQIVTDEPNPSRSYQPVTVGVIVTSVFEIPTGIVNVTTNANNSECSIQLVNGMGSCEIGYAEPGAYLVTASYGGDEFHTSSSDSKSHDVIKAETTTSLLSHVPNPSLEGQPISITFEVTSTYGIPTGTVIVAVSNSMQSCNDDLVDGMGSCMITLESQGAYTITAAYSGNTYFSPSQAVVSHQVADFLKQFIPLILRSQ